MAKKKPQVRREIRFVVPAEMKAAAIDTFGPPSVLKLHTVPVPRPGPHEVLIAVHAAGVGVWDAKRREGIWGERDPGFPVTIGADGAGVIVEMGEHVRRHELGDRVWAYQFENSKGGFGAEYVVVDADHVGALPSPLTMLQGGAAAVTGLTALQGCDDQLEIRRGETVMIFGASGAVGTLAVQFAARYRKARVIAIASGASAAKLLTKLGASIVIDGRRRDALERIEAAAPDGLDAILALADSPVLRGAMKLVRRGGRVAYPNGVEPKPRRKGTRVIGYDADSTPAAFARLARAVDAIPFEVPIAASYSLAHASQAHARLERGHVVGRIALKIR